jgi:hypothetical protein
MKVTDLRRKLLAALAAGGLLAPSAMYAANLNTNLVVNGDFELVDTVNAPFGAYNAPRILNWVGSGVAYSHDASLSNGMVVPNYANGAAPPNAGHWYFTSNAGNAAGITDKNGPGQFYQDIDVSGGDTATAISSGFAGFDLSAYMSGYFRPSAGGTDPDIAKVHLEFRSGAGNVLGTALMSDSDAGTANVWSANNLTGVVPVGTKTVRVSAYSTPVVSGPDGYIDNLEMKVSIVPLPALRITVSRANGSVSLSNDTGAAVNLSGYSITSAFEGLTPASWLSIADNYDNGNPGPNQVDSAHSWTKLTAAGAHGDLSEADLQAGTGASLANGRTVNLSSAAGWVQNPNEDLIFQYISGGQVKNGIVSFIGNNDNPFALGDLNTDGSINVADWVLLRTNQQTNLTSLSKAQAYRLGDLDGDLHDDFADFALFKNAYDVANGAGSFAVMAASVPEPSTALLVLATGTIFLSARRRKQIAS